MKISKLAIVVAMLVAVIGLPQSATAQNVFHGIGFLKSAESPVNVGDPYLASYQILNVADGAQDTLEVSGLSDTVHASGGDVTSGNIITQLAWTFSGGAAYKDATHTVIVMPFGSTAVSNSFSFYTVVLGDALLPASTLQDTATLTFKDDCTGISSNCPSGQTLTTQAGGSATVIAPVPCVNVTKTVDCPVATVGKLVTYTITVTNCGQDDLTKVSINDSLLGPLGGCDSLAVGASCVLNPTHTIAAQDADPLVNTVTVNYVDVFQQAVTNTASATVDIIHPSYSITKVCDALSKPISGPSAFFDVTITNTGDVELTLTTNEAAQSDTPEPITVPVGGTKNILITKPSTCPQTDVSNQITASATVAGLDCPITPIQHTAPAEGSVTCFCAPTIDVTKVASCDVATIGQLETYTITITNTGGDTLNLVSVSDTILGDLTSTAQTNGCTTLIGGASCTFTVTHTIAAGDADPLVNVVSVDYVNAEAVHATDSAQATVDVIHPNFTVTKTCAVDPIPTNGPATFTVVVANTGDVPLSFTTNEAAQSNTQEPFTVAAGASQTLTITVTATGTADVANTIQVTATLADEPVCTQFNTGNVKTAQDTCHGAGAATRTWGFWKTHTAFTECVFDKCGSSFDLGWRQVTTYAQLFGILEADVAKNSDGTRRCALGQARETASRQVLAALLNTCLDNGKPLPAGITPCSIKNTLTCGTVAQVIALNNQLDIYNNSGDTVKLAVTEPCVQGSATPKDSLAAATIPFANTTGGSDCTASTGCPACP